MGEGLTNNNLHLPRAVSGMQAQVLIKEWYARGSTNKPQMCNGDGDHNTRQTLDKAISAACSTIGLASQKAKQREAISMFVGGQDVFISLPTGYGKSLCYALLPLVFDYVHGIDRSSIVVCVSPLT